MLVYDGVMRKGSKENYYFMGLKYKKDHLSGVQFIKFCYYHNLYVAKFRASDKVRIAFERDQGEKEYIDWVGYQS